MKGLKPFLSLAVGILGCVIMAGCAGSIPQNGPSALNIAEFTVSDGVIGLPYKFLLIASGGVKPYTWTISDGQLPPGLSLNSDGVISGTPTTLGKFSFTMMVTDSQSPVQAYNTKQASLTVNSVLSCCTGTMPTGTVGASYSATVTASNGLQPYTYTLADPTNQPLPPGLTLATTSGQNGAPNVGTISGIPTTAGVFTFSVQATDADSEVSTAQFTITVIGKLQGPYVLYFNGFDYNQPFYDVAQLVAGDEDKNGTGTITGVLDQMGPGSSVTTGLPVTGSYTLSQTNNFGTLTIIRSDNQTSLNFDIVVSASTSGDSKVILADPNAPNAYGSGLLKKQSTSTTSGSIASYSFGLFGTDAGGNRYAGVGMFALGAGSGTQAITGGEEDLNDNGTVSLQVPITAGTLTQLDPNTGRGTYTLTTGSGTKNYVYYVVSATELVALDTDTGGPFTLVDLQQQQPAGSSGAFSNAALKGQSIIGLDGVVMSGGSPVPAAAVGVVAFDGAGNIKGPTATDGTVLSGYYTDESDGGTVGPVQYPTGTYNVDQTCGPINQACGRVTVNLAGAPTQPVWYISAPNTAFALDTNPSVMSGTLTLQNVPQVLFNIGSILGAYLGNTITPVLPTITNELDVATTPSIKTTVWSQIFDASGPGGVVNQFPFTGAYNCGDTVPACSDLGTYYGRFTITGPVPGTNPVSIAYVIGTSSSGVTGSKGGAVSVNVGEQSSGDVDHNPRLTIYGR